MAIQAAGVEDQAVGAHRFIRRCIAFDENWSFTALRIHLYLILA